MTRPRLQALLAIGGIGAALVLVNLLGTTGGVIGVVLMLVSAIFTAPAAPEQGSEGLNWWTLLVAGTALAIVGVPLAIVLETPGGLIAAFGGGTAMVGVAFGMP